MKAPRNNQTGTIYKRTVVVENCEQLVTEEFIKTVALCFGKSTKRVTQSDKAHRESIGGYDVIIEDRSVEVSIGDYIELFECGKSIGKYRVDEVQCFDFCGEYNLQLKTSLIC